MTTILTFQRDLFRFLIQAAIAVSHLPRVTWCFLCRLVEAELLAQSQPQSNTVCIAHFAARGPHPLAQSPEFLDAMGSRYGFLPHNGTPTVLADQV